MKASGIAFLESKGQKILARFGLWAAAAVETCKVRRLFSELHSESLGGLSSKKGATVLSFVRQEARQGFG
jgi:hypothetical protein